MTSPGKRAASPLGHLVERGAEHVRERLDRMSPLAWRIDSLDWDVPYQDVLYSFPKGGSPLDKLYGSYFSMPGAAVMAVFPASTAASLTQQVVASFGAVSKTIPPEQALAEVSNILVNAIGGVLADACKFSFFLPPPDVFLASKPDLLEKLGHAVMQLQGPGRQAPSLARITLRSADFECVLLVLLGESWQEAVKNARP